MINSVRCRALRPVDPVIKSPVPGTPDTGYLIGLLTQIGLNGLPSLRRAVAGRAGYSMRTEEPKYRLIRWSRSFRPNYKAFEKNIIRPSFIPGNLIPGEIKDLVYIAYDLKSGYKTSQLSF